MTDTTSSPQAVSPARPLSRRRAAHAIVTRIVIPFHYCGLSFPAWLPGPYITRPDRAPVTTTAR